MTLLYKNETKSAVMHANKALHSGNPSVPFCFSLNQEVEQPQQLLPVMLNTLKAAQKKPGQSCSQSVQEDAGIISTACHQLGK